MPPGDVDFRRLRESEHQDFRDLWLKGLEAHPEAFTISSSSAREWPKKEWQRRIREYEVTGCWQGYNLLGIASLGLNRVPKRIHIAVLGPVYLDPSLRGRGLAGELVEHSIAALPWFVEQIYLAVGTENHAARKLYERLGFKAWGTEPRALKLEDGRYIDEVWMVRDRNIARS